MTRIAIVTCQCGTEGERKADMEYENPYTCARCRSVAAEGHQPGVGDAMAASVRRLEEAGLRADPDERICKGCQGAGIVQGQGGREPCGACQGWGYDRTPRKRPARRAQC